MNHDTLIDKKNVTPHLEPGLKGLAAYLDNDTHLYILRSLYRLVFYSNRLGENKEQLKSRLKRFEKESGIPKFLSTMTVDCLLTELEDAQYFFPIHHNEIKLPTFH